MAEATALGCALAAGLAVGIWKDVKALVEMHEQCVKYDKFQVQVFFLFSPKFWANYVCMYDVYTYVYIWSNLRT